MPFLKDSERRKEMDEIVDWMDNYDVKADGDLNYVLYKFCKYSIKPSYNNYKNYLGELRECCEQIERDLLAPYEEEAKERNGDI